MNSYTHNFSYKENYIADMLIDTLYSNDVSNSECYRIIDLFKEKVLGNVDMDFSTSDCKELLISIDKNL